MLFQDLIKPLYDFAVENIGLVSYEDDCIITGTRHDEHMLYEGKINGIRIKRC